MTSIIVMQVIVIVIGLVAIAVIGMVASVRTAGGRGGATLSRSTRRRIARAKRELNKSLLNRRGVRR